MQEAGLDIAAQHYSEQVTSLNGALERKDH